MVWNLAHYSARIVNIYVNINTDASIHPKPSFLKRPKIENSVVIISIELEGVALPANCYWASKTSEPVDYALGGAISSERFHLPDIGMDPLPRHTPGRLWWTLRESRSPTTATSSHVPIHVSDQRYLYGGGSTSTPSMYGTNLQSSAVPTLCISTPNYRCCSTVGGTEGYAGLTLGAVILMCIIGIDLATKDLLC